MEQYDRLPEALKNASRSLQPFIKQRQEVTQIRKTLSSHLSVHLNADSGLPFSRPLSLVDPTNSINATPHGVRGIRKDYLRCIRANIKARKEYSKASAQHHVGLEEQIPGVGARDPSTSRYGVGDSMVPFLDLIRQRRKHERLRIIQDYINMLAQKPAASAEYLNPQEVLKDVETLPKVPAEVVNASSSSSNQAVERKKLKDLVDQLEKSVLRAKMLLKREQKLLAKVRAENIKSEIIYGDRLQAVELTRHELINWIEGELARAGDNPLEFADGQSSSKSDGKEKEHIDAGLTAIQRQYARYTTARQELITTSTARMEIPASAELDRDKDPEPTKEESHQINGVIQAIQTYLEQMVSVSNEQKSMIQQKSHLSISLAKQLKEGHQGLDRLAHESHLLPAHPVPALASQRLTLEVATSFGEQMSNHEKPDTSRRAQAWVFASAAAADAVKDAISENIRAGTASIMEARKILFELHNLLGRDTGTREQSANTGGTVKEDIWAALDGNLGVIRADVAEP